MAEHDSVLQSVMQQQNGVYSDHNPEANLPALELNTPQVQPNVAMEGQHLYLDFLRQEMQNQQLNAPLGINDEFAEISEVPAITELTVLLNQFARSDERNRVRDMAQQVELEGINYESFSGLLSGLFQGGGMTYERVLVLFCFCADVSLRALRESALQYFQSLTSFSVRFITSTLCIWVQTRGGWAAVVQGLRRSCGTYGVAAIGCLAMVAVGTALWNK